MIKNISVLKIDFNSKHWRLKGSKASNNLQTGWTSSHADEHQKNDQSTVLNFDLILVNRKRFRETIKICSETLMIQKLNTTF